MTKKCFSTKTFILTIILVLSFIFMQNAWFFASFTAQKSTFVSANDSSPKSTINVSDNISNNNFASTSGSSLPASPSSWSVWDSDTHITPEASGVIDLTQTTYQNNYVENYKLGNFTTQPAQRIGVTEQYVLMINSGNNGDNTVSINYGYKTSSDFSLAPNSFYSISAYVFTSDNAHASIYLTGTEVEQTNTNAITGINATGWTQATIYVATGTEKEISAGLQLFLGEKGTENTSAGYVLFDNVTMNRYSGEQFEKVLNTAPKSTFVDLRPSFVSAGNDGFVANGDFSTALNTDWTQQTAKNGNSAYIANLSTAQNINNENVTIGTNQRGNQKGVILSANGGYNSIKSADIKIKQSQLYKISFWAKGSINTGNINFKIGGNLPDETVDEETPVSASITSLATDTTALNNFWGLYSFYVEGNPLFDSTVNLYLGLGSDSADATGYIAITDIKTEKVTTTHKSNSTSNSATLQMFGSNSLSFTNASFNYIDIDEVNANYPYSPQNWTKTNSNASGISGVVNIESTRWANAGFNFSRPQKTGIDDSDNVLMIRNTSNSYQSYTSKSVSLSADSYALITVEVSADNLTQGSYGYIFIKNSDAVILATVKISNTSKWQTYKIYLHNYYIAQDLTAELALGTSDNLAQGNIYFDNCIIDTSITEDDFTSAQGLSGNVSTIDLVTETLEMANSDGSPILFEGNNASSANTDNLIKGIMDVRNYEDYFEGNPTAPSDDNNKVMFIGSTENAYYYYASKLTYSFTSGTYYKLTVKVRTVNITADSEGDYNDEGVQIIHGASIAISGIDKSFTGINTGKESKTGFDDPLNVWTEYTMYINTTEDVDGTIQLGLGTSTMLTAGYAFFADLQVISMTEDEYKSETVGLDENDLPNNILLATNTTEDEEDDQSTYNSIDWFAIPTIIIAIAVIVAVVGFFIKKIYQNKPKKTATINNNYDRLQTLMKDVDRRERKTAITHKLKLLHEELEQSKQFLQQESEELERQTQAYNTAKEIAQDSPNVEIELPDIKSIEDSILIQQEKIEQIELDIQILEDERNRINKQVKRDIDNIDKQEKQNSKSKNIKTRK